MHYVTINDFNHWRIQARELLRRRISPADITWQAEKQTSLMLDSGEDFLSLAISYPNPAVPRDFFYLAKNVSCYRDESRWPLLYSMAWRLVFEDRNLLDFKTDEQVSRLLSMQKAVGRDIHKMEAFVRFRKIDKPFDWHKNDEPEKLTQNEEYFVSWFEPQHLILPSISPFFVKRFNNMHWSILTPDLCAHWNGKQLTFTEGESRSPTAKDDLENMWRVYYANIFNPARLKLKAMQSEMPKKYWVNLPEATLINELTRSAGKKVDNMLTNSIDK